MALGYLGLGVAALRRRSDSAREGGAGAPTHQRAKLALSFHTVFEVASCSMPAARFDCRWAFCAMNN